MGLFKWIGRRAKEKSTYVGIGTVIAGAATAAGKPEIAAGVEPVLSIILAVLGGILIGKPAPAAVDQPFLPLR